MKPLNIPGVADRISVFAFILVWVDLLCQPLFHFPIHVLVLPVLLGLAVIALYLLRFTRPEWRPQRTNPFSSDLVFLTLMVAPSSLAGIHPLSSSLYGTLVIASYFAFLAFREAFTSSPGGLLSPRMFFSLLAGGAVLLVLSRLLLSFIAASDAVLPWYCLVTEMGGEGKRLDYLADFLLIAGFPFIVAVSATAVGVWKRMAWNIAIAVMAIGLLLSFCRAAWIALALEVVLLALLGRSRRRVLLVGLAASCVAALFLPGGMERLGSVFSMGRGTNMQRIEQWAGSFELIRHSPFVGYGLGSFGELYQKLRGPGSVPVYPWPHNLFLHLAVECGLPALFIFLGRSVFFLRALRSEDAGGAQDAGSFDRAFRMGAYVSILGMLCFGLFDM